MSNDSIKIFNPSSGPYSQLSPAFAGEVLIDDKPYPSPLSYIYGRVITSPAIRARIQTGEHPASLVEAYRQKLSRDALAKGSFCKFKVPQYKKQLLQTGSSELVYLTDESSKIFDEATGQVISGDTHVSELGVNNEFIGQGYNRMGKLLMKIRDLVTVISIGEVQTERKTQYIQNAHALLNAYYVMQSLIESGNNDLVAILAKTRDQDYKSILVDIPETYSLDAVERLITTNSLPLPVVMELSKPGIMVHYLIQTYGPSFAKKSISRIENLLLSQSLVESVYNTDKEKFFRINRQNRLADDVIEKNLRRKSLEKARNIIEELEEAGRKDLRSRLYILWKANLISLPIDSNLDALNENINNSRAVWDEAVKARRAQVDSEFLADGPLDYSKIAAIRKMLIDPSVSADTILREIGIRQDLSRSSIVHHVASKQSEMLQIISRHWADQEDVLVDMMVDGFDKQFIFFRQTVQNTIEDYAFLSPESTEFLITVDGLQFPSVASYVLAVLITHLTNPRNLLIESYPLLLHPSGIGFKKLEQMDEIYQRALREFPTLVEEYTRKALESRIMNNTELKQLLASTGRKPITYEDSNDSVLGVGPGGQGMNIVGKILMEIRQRLADSNVVASAGPSAKAPVATSKMWAEFSTNTALQQWFDMRLKDAIDTSMRVGRYLKLGYLNRKVLDFVLHKLYANCMSIYDMNVEVRDIPTKFVKEVNNLLRANGAEVASPEVVGILWNFMQRLYSKFAELIISRTSDSTQITQIVGQILARSFIEIRQNFDCSGPFPEPIKNCIISAIGLTLQKLGTFYERVVQLDPTITFRQFKMDQKLLSLVFSIITPNIPMVVEDMEKETDDHNHVLSYLHRQFIPLTPKLQKTLANIIANYINQIAQEISRQEYSKTSAIASSRILFFS